MLFICISGYCTKNSTHNLDVPAQRVKVVCVCVCTIFWKNSRDNGWLIKGPSLKPFNTIVLWWCEGFKRCPSWLSIFAGRVSRIAARVTAFFLQYGLVHEQKWCPKRLFQISHFNPGKLTHWQKRFDKIIFDKIDKNVSNQTRAQLLLRTCSILGHNFLP